MVLVICTAGYKVKIEWVDTYKERQTANFWLFLVQRGEFDRAMLLVNEKACKDNGFRDFDIIEKYYEQGYFEGATVSKMFINDQGKPVAMVELPKSPEFNELLLQVEHEGDKFQIKEVNFVSGERGIIDKLLNGF